MIEEHAPSSKAASPSVLDPQAEAASLKDEAISAARIVAESYPGDALTHALLGSAYHNLGISREAEVELRRCLEINPDIADAYNILARIAYERGNLDEAIELYRQSLQRAPGNPEALHRLGRALMDAGQTAEAIEVLRRATRLARPTSESFYLLGQTLLLSGEASAARTNFLQAVQLLPDHTQAYFGLFTASQRLGRTEEAQNYRREFERLEAADRHSLTERSAREDTLSGLPLVRKSVAQTLFGAAQIHQLHRDTRRPAELLFRCATLDPDHPGYRAALEAYYTQTGALEDGIAAFTRLTSSQPTNWLNPLFLGRLQTRRQQFAPSEQAFRKVVELAPDRPEGYRALADLYLRTQGHSADALAMARKTVDLEPSPAHWHLLSRAYVRNNDETAARQALQRAAALDPSEPRYRELPREAPIAAPNPP